MKKVICFAAIALLCMFVFGENPPQKKHELTSQSHYFNHDYNNANTLLQKLVSGIDQWYLVDSLGHLLQAVTQNGEQETVNAYMLKNSYTTGRFYVTLPGNTQYEITGMRIDGGTSHIANIVLWLKSKNNTKYKLVSNYVIGNTSLQNAINLAETYAIVLR